jgi:hypothetical protein
LGESLCELPYHLAKVYARPALCSWA